MEKRCSVCGVEKPVEEFHCKSKAKDGRRDRCKVCAATYHRQHYTKNKQRYIAQALERKRKLMVFLAEQKQGPCTDCGVVYPSYVMQFDHLGIEDKDMDVGQLVQYGSKKRILDEISKCELVCANCHAERTHKRRAGMV